MELLDLTAAPVAPTIARAGQVVTVEFDIDAAGLPAPLAALMLETPVQRVTCAPAGISGWRCEYPVLGTEPEGPGHFSVVLDYGAQSTHPTEQRPGPPITFDFRCALDAARIALISEDASALRLVAPEGSAEPGAPLLLTSTDAGSGTPVSVTAGTDGSLQSQPLPEWGSYELSGTDPVGNPCAPQVLAPRVRLSSASRDASGAALDLVVVRPTVLKTLLPAPAALEAGPAASEQEREAAGREDGVLLTVTAPTAAALPRWEQRNIAGPPARTDAAIAYDGARQRVLLFGGADANGAVLGDTWTWDGSTWSHQAPASAPAPRRNAALAFDPARQTVLLYGGFSASDPLGDTWEWDGSTWTRLEEDSALVRGSCSMAEDSWRGRALLGCELEERSATSVIQRSTATWEGNAWVDHSTSGWASFGLRGPLLVSGDRCRSGALRLAYVYSLVAAVDTLESWTGTEWVLTSEWVNSRTHVDATPRPAAGSRTASADTVRCRTLLLAPPSGVTGALRTWEWDGVNWLTRSPSLAPLERTGGALVFDAARNTTLLFGGAAGTQALADTWEYRADELALPALLATVRLPARNGALPTRALISLQARGTSLLDDGAPVSGLEFYAWNVAEQRWSRVAFSRGAQLAAQLEGNTLAEAVEADELRLLLVAPAGSTVRGGARLELDALGVELTYP